MARGPETPEEEEKMKDLRKPIAVTLSAALLALAVLSGCARVSSRADETAPPETTPATTSAVATAASLPDSTAPAGAAPLARPAAEMDIEQLMAEFKADPAAAEAKYGGKRFVFRGVNADDISSLYKPINTDMWVMHGNVKFRPEYPSMLTDLKVYSLMDIEGTVGGMQYSYIIIADCRYTVTDTTNAIERPDFQYVFA